MPGKIAFLPPEITNRIAAGEVVERPASILKELLENAIDAGATEIVVSLEKGDQGSIRVVDNGEGIAPADVPMAFARYATSKIHGFDDIYAIRTFGFRGEALPSIASISRVTILSRKSEALVGIKAVVETGQIREQSEAGCPAGTSFTVDRIFASVPVRRKFLKSETTEQGYCLDVLNRIALSHPEIKLRLVNNGREAFNLPSAASSEERISLVLGRDSAAHLVPVRSRHGDIMISGFVSTPTLVKSNSRHIYFYINRRYTRDHLLNHAVMTSYRHLLEAKKYPAAILFIDLLPAAVDVNVHPAKLEVRFQNPRAVYEAVLEAVVGALAGVASTVARESKTAGGERADISRYRFRVEEALKRYAPAADRGSLFPVLPTGFTAPTESDDAKAMTGAGAVKSEPGASTRFSDLGYVGQVRRTYLIFSAEDKMVLLDQHAAHERILFEKMCRDSSLKPGNAVGQRLLLPEVITLTARDLPFLLDALPILNGAGMEIEPFGGDAVIVKSIPAFLHDIKPADIIGDLLDGFSEADRLLGLKEREEKIFTLLACKGAIKAGHSLTAEEAKALCRDLDAVTFASTCPHGRPLYVSFSMADLEKMFRRR